MSVELNDGEVRLFRIFTGNTESDPHRVAFYSVTVSTDGITLELREVPRGEEERADVSWADLHAMLGQKDALVAEVADIRADIRLAEHELIALRGERRRMRERVRRGRMEVERLDARILKVGHRMAVCR